MAALSKPRRERFAREYIKSGVAGVAYAKAYARPFPDATSYANGHRLLKYADINIRLCELREQAMKRADITIDKILNDYQEALNMARAKDEAHNMVNAATAQAKLVGLLRDRVETGNAGDFENMDSIAEILAKVAETEGPGAAIALSNALKVAPTEPEFDDIVPSDALN